MYKEMINKNSNKKKENGTKLRLKEKNKSKRSTIYCIVLKTTLFIY
jgi:hypothetical protein